MLLGDLRRPRAPVEVAWRHHYAGVWFFDKALRRTARHEFRQLTDDRLFLLETVDWRCAEGQSEFDPGAWKRRCRYDPDGSFEASLEPAGERGGLRVTRGHDPVETLWEPVPRFGAWASLARRDRGQPAGLTLIQRPDPGDEADADAGSDADRPGGGSGLPPEQRPWRPPQPLAPSNLDALFDDGTRLALPLDDKVHTVRIEVRKLGRLRMPSGRLVAVDPALISFEREPLADGVPPGSWPVALAVAHWEPHPVPWAGSGRGRGRSLAGA